MHQYPTLQETCWNILECSEHKCSPAHIAAKLKDATMRLNSSSRFIETGSISADVVVTAMPHCMHKFDMLDMVLPQVTMLHITSAHLLALKPAF